MDSKTTIYLLFILKKEYKTKDINKDWQWTQKQQ